MGAGLNKVRNRVNLINKQNYKEFITKFPKSEISYETFIKVLKESNKRIGNYILTNELGFKVPYNLGYIAITKFAQKEDYKVIDWVNTSRLNKVIPLTNLHSFGNMFKFELYKNRRIKPLLAYKMTAHRLIKRTLAKRIKDGKQNYLKLDNSYFNKRFAIERIIKNNN